MQSAGLSAPHFTFYCLSTFTSYLSGGYQKSICCSSIGIWYVMDEVYEGEFLLVVYLITFLVIIAMVVFLSFLFPFYSFSVNLRSSREEGVCFVLLWHFCWWLKTPRFRFRMAVSVSHFSGASSTGSTQQALGWGWWADCWIGRMRQRANDTDFFLGI
jgi:hypothetical protein